MKVIFRKIQTFINKPQVLLIKTLQLVSPFFSDSIYLKMLFPLKTGYKLNMDNPQTYNEKLQWLKIHYRRPILTQMVDKYEAKKYTAHVIGEQYAVKNYGIWNSFEEINFDSLPNQFVLKTTHDQGGVVICLDKDKFNFKAAKKKLTSHLRTKHFYLTREWPYKNVKPRILAEELLTDAEKGDLWDYKFYCFHGEPKIMYISMGRNTGTHVPLYYFDEKFNFLGIERPNHEPDNRKITKPKNWNLMIQLAQKASAGFPHVRVDFFNIGNKIFSGEYTFYQGGGMMPFVDKDWDYKMGELIDLEEVKNSKYFIK